MLRRRFFRFLLLMAALGALMYGLVSLYLPSSRRLVVGVNKSTGSVRTVAQTITFLPPHQFYRLSFDKRGQYAQRDGVVRINSKENVPLKITYRIRFALSKQRLPDSKRLVAEGWTAWLNARVTEAVRAVSSQVPIEDFASPTSDFAERRNRFRDTVARHLDRSGLQVTAFEIERIEIDREALLAYKRLDLRRNARGAMGRVAIISLEGADWELVQELSDDDRIPNLKALIQRGTTASVQTIQPTVSPLLATTVATGLTPDRHGVLDFTDRIDRATPVSSFSRRGPALWEIAPAFGRSTEVVNWWTAWPPRRSGALIFDTPVQESPDALYPADVAPRFASAMVSEASLGYEQVRPFLNITQGEFQGAVSAAQPSDPVAALRSVLAKTWTDHRIAIAGYKLYKPTLLMMSYEGTDTVNHLFGPYHPPQREGVSEESYRKYWPAVAAYYSEIDRLIGEWMQVIPPDTTVMIFSSHGMRWGKERPKAPPAGASALSVHRNPGVFIAYGNQILPSRARHTMMLHDFAPTTLALLGLPAAKEMPGHIIDWAFNGLTPVSVAVTGYGDFIEQRIVATSAAVDPAGYKRRLQLIGHIPDAALASMPMLDEDEAQKTLAVTPEQWGLYAYYNNLGISLKTQGKSKEAIEAFQKAIELNPTRPIPYLNQAMLLFEKGQYTAADEAFLEAVNRGLPSAERYFIDFASLYRSKDLMTRASNVLIKAKQIFPQSETIAANLGSSLASADRYTEAVPELERALGISPGSTLVLNNLGSIYLKKKDYGRALDYWNRSLSIEPQQPEVRGAVDAVKSHL